MEKYFMQDSKEEVKFGDKIVKDWTEEEGDNITHHHLACTFCPALVDMLVEKGIITVEKEPESKASDTLDFEFEEENEEDIELAEALGDLVEAQERTASILDEVCEAVALLTKEVMALKAGQPKAVKNVKKPEK